MHVWSKTCDVFKYGLVQHKVMASVTEFLKFSILGKAIIFEIWKFPIFRKIGVFDRQKTMIFDKLFHPFFCIWIKTKNEIWPLRIMDARVWRNVSGRSKFKSMCFRWSPEKYQKIGTSWHVGIQLNSISTQTPNWDEVIVMFLCKNNHIKHKLIYFKKYFNSRINSRHWNHRQYFLRYHESALPL